MRHILFVFMFMFLTGCNSAPTIQLKIDPPRVTEYVEGNIRATQVSSIIDVRDLDNAAREYVLQNGIEFDFRGTSGSFIVDREREYLASGSYESGLGYPVLTVEIGWDGHVRNHRVGIAVCGTCQDLLEGTDPGTGEEKN